MRHWLSDTQHPLTFIHFSGQKKLPLLWIRCSIHGAADHIRFDHLQSNVLIHDLVPFAISAEITTTAICRWGRYSSCNRFGSWTVTCGRWKLFLSATSRLVLIKSCNKSSKKNWNKKLFWLFNSVLTFFPSESTARFLFLCRSYSKRS